MTSGMHCRPFEGRHLVFYLKIMCFFRGLLKKIYFFHFFLENELDIGKINRKVLWRYKKVTKCKKTQFSTLKIATCEAFLINTKILSFSQKNWRLAMHRRNKNVELCLRIAFYISVPNFRAPGPIMKLFYLEQYAVPLKAKTMSSRYNIIAM